MKPIVKRTIYVDEFFWWLNAAGGNVNHLFYKEIVRRKGRVLSKLQDENFACPKCGMPLKIIRQQRFINSNRWTLAYYGVKRGRLVQFTIDHIIPLSKGGTDENINIQLLCEDCNKEKSNKIFEEDIRNMKDAQKRRITKKIKIWAKDNIYRMILLIIINVSLFLILFLIPEVNWNKIFSLLCVIIFTTYCLAAIDKAVIDKTESYKKSDQRSEKMRRS